VTLGRSSDGPAGAGGAPGRAVPLLMPADAFLAEERSVRQAAIRWVSVSAPVVLFTVVAVLIWAAIVKVFAIPVAELPTPAATWDSLTANASELLSNAGPTVSEALVGYALAIVVGIPLGYAISRRGPVAAGLRQAVLATQIFPKVAIAPLLTVLLGFGELPKYLFIFLLGIFPIAMNTAAGFASVPLELNELGAVTGFNALARLWRLQLPWSLPQIFTGLKLSATFVLTGALVYEFVSGQEGLGVLILRAQNDVDAPLMISALVVVGIVGFLLYGIIAALEAIAIPWHISRRRGDR
jgi:NitT/TauT family transport system permease protein